MLKRQLRIISLCAILSMLGLLLPSFAHGVAAAPVLTVGANVNVSAASNNQAEPTIAVDPTNPLRIFVASNPGTTVAYSTDGGATWTRYSIPGTCCDNVAVFDQFGNLFLINIDSGLDRIDLYLSTTGGTSGSFNLLQTLDTASNDVDQPTVAVGAGSVWATWRRGGNIRARGAAVTGLGAGNIGAFNAIQTAPSSGTGQFGDIAIGPSGQVTVTYQNNNNIFVATDADGLGAGGFGSRVTVTGTNVDTFDFITPQSGPRSTPRRASSTTRAAARITAISTWSTPTRPPTRVITRRYSCVSPPTTGRPGAAGRSSTTTRRPAASSSRASRSIG